MNLYAPSMNQRFPAPFVATTIALNVWWICWNGMK